MCEIYSEVCAVLSSKVISAIDGCVLESIQQSVLTATVEQVLAENETQYHLRGTLDGIVSAKAKLEELLTSLRIKREAKEAQELDSTTLSEENSSIADEGNTSYDKEGTDKTSCLSDDKEQETNASSNGYISTNTESSTKMMRPKPLSKKLRFLLKERPRVGQRRMAAQLRTFKKKSKLRNDPDVLSENLKQMKLATEDSDFDSGEAKGELPIRRPCKVKNHDPSSFKHFCELCSFKTKRSSHFMKHMSVHEKVLSCPHCSYQTTKQHYYDRHQRLHCSKRTSLHQCSQCCYKTHRKEHYVRHVNNVHREKRPYLCHVCGKAFKRAEVLRQHSQLHSETQTENSHQCTLCQKRFRSVSHLREHQSVHSEARTFLCEMCGACFKTRSVHRKHIQSIHRNARTFLCDACGKKFSTVYSLKRHRKTHSKSKDGQTTTETNNETGDEDELPKTSSFIPTLCTPLSVIPSALPVPIPKVILPSPAEVCQPTIAPPIFQAAENTTVYYLAGNLPHV